MKPISRLFVSFVSLLLGALDAAAVSGVNPTGVNVRATGPTTVFITFQNLDPNERSVEAFWCGAVIAGVGGGSVTATNPCVPGTIFGRLPLRHDLSRQSAAGAFTNLTDIMTIPASVARRAYQDAQAGNASDFFYVRRFTGGAAGDRYAVVTCRMAGGGARSPLALLDVRVAFETEKGQAPVLFMARGHRLPPFGANIAYNGSGTLIGRWEVVLPGDIEPTTEDLLTEATLPIERRGLQRRYTLLKRFEIFLPPTGKVYIPGPDPAQVPHEADGPYKILLRIEASRDKEGDSNTLAGVVASGGVAGFAMPVLRYYIGTPATLEKLRAEPSARLQLMLPQDGGALAPGAPIHFSWVDVAGASLYRLEVEGETGRVISALVNPGVSAYTAPPWIAERAGRGLRWRVVALDAAGLEMAQSAWRSLRVAGASVR